MKYLKNIIGVYPNSGKNNVLSMPSIQCLKLYL